MSGFFQSLSIPFRMVFIMWAVYVINRLVAFDFTVFGIFPRQVFGLIGILTMPFIHVTDTHLLANTFPLLFLGVTLFYFYDRIAVKAFFQCYLLTGVLIWIFARPSFHIGASGVIYAIATFLVFFGIFRKDFKSLLITVVIIVMYGSMIYGILPTQKGVSWESHLLGAIVGAGLAYRYCKMKRVST